LNDVHTQLDVNMPSLLTSKNQQLDSWQKQKNTHQLKMKGL
jgi:hypothetical protein